MVARIILGIAGSEGSVCKERGPFLPDQLLKLIKLGIASASNESLPISFSNTFERLRKTVTKDEARSFASTSMENIWITAKDIERHLEARRSFIGFRRIQPFLAGME